MQATIQYIKKELAGLYPETELQGFMRLLFETICGWNYSEQILNRDEKIDDLQFQRFKKIVLRLKKHEPIQYILGETEFMGINIKVNSSVLIPRPETEELVHWIINSNNLDSPRILDIGTGSACISIALKNQIQGAEISGVDISNKTLETAKINSLQNSMEIKFYERDILKWVNYDWENYDIIVSNPPYVCEFEKAKMDENVLGYEPEDALFVPDSDPLIFYRHIAEFAEKHLVNKGKLFFEINERLGDEMYKLLLSCGFKNVELKKDLNGKNRMIYCQKK